MSSTVIPTSNIDNENPFNEGVSPSTSTLSNRRLKVLICAYACSPSQGSEEGVGWGWVESISRLNDLWVLVGDQCKHGIEEELERRPEIKSRIHFSYIPRYRNLTAERFWPPSHFITYRRWQERAFSLGQKLHSQVHFDIVHQLTYVGFRAPGRLWTLGVPFVWGPIGGLEQTTWGLLPSLGLRGCFYYVARNLLNDWDRRFSRLPKRAFQAAEGGIIAATTGIQREIRRFYRQDSSVISEIGLPPVTCIEPMRRQVHEPLHLLWSGLHIPRKALPFLFDALQTLPSNLLWKLTILGDGPCRAKWENAVNEMGISSRCEWLGQVARSAALAKMQSAHVLVVTSVYDLTSTVIVEALANALPVICPDHCGFTDAITSECGIRTNASSRRDLISGIRDAIVTLSNENIRYDLARGASARSHAYHWEKKAFQLDRIYRDKQMRGVHATCNVESVNGGDSN